MERALVITAHPDDVDFGAAGTVATLTSAGVEALLRGCGAVTIREVEG